MGDVTGTVSGAIASIILGHGASGSAASMRPWVEALESRGLAARAIDLPKGKAERAVPAFAAQIPPAGPIVIGGHSFGGRVASLVAAGITPTDAQGSPIRGLLLLSYPLHRPGAPETWRERTSHWSKIGCPVLLLSGESDPFARIDLLREAVPLLTHGMLVTYPRVGHGLATVLPDAADRAAAFIRSL